MPENVPNSADAHADVRAILFPTIISRTLQDKMRSSPGVEFALIIECNVDHSGGPTKSKGLIRELILAAAGAEALRRDRDSPGGTYVYAMLNLGALQHVLAADGESAMGADVERAKQEAGALTPAAAQDVVPPAAPRRGLRAIRRVWDSPKMERLATQSIKTVKADAAHAAFTANGAGVVWAVLDTGVDATHPHFKMWDNVLTQSPMVPKNFTADPKADPLFDANGHGTHVAGVIAGQWEANTPALAAVQSISEDGTPGDYHLQDVSTIRGMAPKCKILSLRIFDDNGDGDAMAAMQALEYVLELNSYGAHIRVHGVNMSAGYLPDAKNYGVGHSPLCSAVDRLSRSGVVVVCAAGNFGWTPDSMAADGTVQQGQSAAMASIADPGNARFAITVGSTHRTEPHSFGVSFFSSKGPTADGRLKPDVVAPGERIVSCAVGKVKSNLVPAVQSSAAIAAPDFHYAEDSGTSMSAPHVSGVIASFLSVRREFMGDSERVSQLLRSSATDLDRDPRMQGAGLVDLFRMLQSV